MQELDIQPITIESDIVEQGHQEEVHTRTVRIAKLFQQFTYWPTYLLLRLLYSYEVEGQENLIGLEEKGVIFASNHASVLDGPVLAAAMPRGSLFPKEFFPVRFLVSKEFFGFRTNPYIFLVSHITTTYVRINGSIPVVRGLGNPSNNLAEAVSAIRGGAKVSIFPEGKITKDGRIQQGKWGVVYLHTATGAPVVPLALIGTHGIPSWRCIFLRNKIRVKIGKPIFSVPENDRKAAVGRVMAEIERLLD